MAAAPKVIRRTAARPSTPSPLKAMPEWTIDPSARGAGITGPVQKGTVRQLRRWSRTNPWIRSAINLRRRQVSRAKWDIVPEDDTTQAVPAKVQPVKDLLKSPNPKGESWRSFIEPVIEDLLVLDQGAFELEATVGGKLKLGTGAPIKYLWHVDGGTIRFDPKWDGTDPGQPRYFQYDKSGQLIQTFLNTELTVLMETPFTYDTLGLSALEVLAETIESDLAAAEYNRKMVKQATPPGIVDLGEGIRPDQVDAFRAYWDAEIAGKSQVAITGGGKGMKWTALAQSNADMQFMEWQLYLARKICAVFACMPQDIGITFDVNRSQGEVGAEFTEDKGIAPLLDLVAQAMTTEVVHRFLPDYKFVFTEMGKASTAAADLHMEKALVGVGWVRPNDALKERGSDGIGPIGDELWVKTTAGPIPMSIYLDKLTNPPMKEGYGPDGRPLSPDRMPDAAERQSAAAARAATVSAAPGDTGGSKTPPGGSDKGGGSAKAGDPFEEKPDRYERLTAFYRPRG